MAASSCVLGCWVAFGCAVAGIAVAGIAFAAVGFAAANKAAAGIAAQNNFAADLAAAHWIVARCMVAQPASNSVSLQRLEPVSASKCTGGTVQPNCALRGHWLSRMDRWLSKPRVPSPTAGCRPQRNLAERAAAVGIVAVDCFVDASATRQGRSAPTAERWVGFPGSPAGP